MKKHSWVAAGAFISSKLMGYAFRPFIAVAAGLLLLSALLAGADTARAEASVVILPKPDSVTCGSSSNITVQVRDFFGFFAVNGTSVKFTTSLGYISGNAETISGYAVSSLTIPPKQSGTAVITASALGVTAQKSIDVSCAGASTPAQAGPIGGPGAAPSQPVQPTSLSVRLANFSYTPSSLTVRAGTPVSLNLTNAGPSPHTFTIAGVTDSGSVAPGANRTLQFTAPQAGNYTFYCTIHGQNVMSGQLTVAQGAPGFPGSPASGGQAPSQALPLPPRIAILPGQVGPIRPPSTGDAGLLPE